MAASTPLRCMRPQPDRSTPIPAGRAPGTQPSSYSACASSSASGSPTSSISVTSGASTSASRPSRQDHRRTRGRRLSSDRRVRRGGASSVPGLGRGSRVTAGPTSPLTRFRLQQHLDQSSEQRSPGSHVVPTSPLAIPRRSLLPESSDDFGEATLPLTPAVIRQHACRYADATCAGNPRVAQRRVGCKVAAARWWC